MQDTTQADTIVLVHGLWMTPRSWEHWVEHFTAKGFKVIAPAYPGFEVEVEALRADPSPIASQTMGAVVAHFEGIIGGLDKKPIIMGHSQGGVIAQILADHGYGAAVVAIDSVPAEGILVVPLSQIKAVFPILSHPSEREGIAPFTPEQFHFAFTNTMSREESDAAYERYYIPAPARFVWEGVLANFTPGKQSAYVNFKNENRAPMLFIAGSDDNIMPPSVNKSNAEHYKAPNTVTDYHEFPGRCHFICGQPGWEEVADYALDWAVKHQKS
ncbi:MAG TPA: alpha/beta hydrolase [Capsulimonadaceae bacterium]